MQYIYARVSTDLQSTSNQLHELRQRYPQAQVVEETTSGYFEKPELERLLAALRAGDVLIVYALDRLGRHCAKALALLEDLNSRGIALISAREGLDMTTAVGKFVATCMLGLAEMERNLIAERTRAALAAKKAEAKQTGNGWTCGRKARVNPAAVHALHVAGASRADIAARLGITPARVCQILKACA